MSKLPELIGEAILLKDKEILRLRAENKKLRSALVCAKDLLGFWSSYAPYYSKEKHGLSDDLAYIAAALKGTRDE